MIHEHLCRAVLVHDVGKVREEENRGLPLVKFSFQKKKKSEEENRDVKILTEA